MIFDTHAHYDDSRFDDDRFQIIEKAFESGVSLILNSASDLDSSKRSIELSQRYKGMYASVGVHPHNAGSMNNETLGELEKLASLNKVVAIGEIGLDYYYDTSPRELQQFWFAQQIDLARRVKLPVIIHDRDAHEDTLNIVKAEKAREVGGVLHCYSGSVEMLKQVLDNNFYISIGGAVTFKNAKRVLEVVRAVPEDRLLLETDCPYMTPEPYRGKRNDSTRVGLVAGKIAEIRGTSIEKILETTFYNACRLFDIS